MLLAELRGAEAAGHDVDQVLDEVTRQSFTGARSIAAVLHGRVRKLDLPAGRTTTWEERMPKAWREQAAREAETGRDDPEGPRPPSERRTLAGVGTASDLTVRRLELGAAAADKPPAWAVRYLGMPPREPGRLRDDWISRVGLVASYREAAGHTDPEQAVGPAPVGQPVLREAYRASVAALEMAEEERARDLPQRDLEARVRGVRPGGRLGAAAGECRPGGHRAGRAGHAQAGRGGQAAGHAGDGPLGAGARSAARGAAGGPG